MRQLVALVLLVVIVVVARAQLPGPHPVRPQKGKFGESDPVAGKILEKTSKHYSKYKSYQVKFKLYFHMPDADTNEVRQGSLLVNGTKYRLQIGEQISVSDGTTVWTYVPDLNEIQITNYDTANAMFEPRDLFSLYKDDYLYQLVKESTLHNRQVWIIDLTPYDKDQSVFKIRLFVDKAKNEILRFVVFEKSGVRYIFDIESFVGDVPLPDAFFTFDVKSYPAAEVVDLR